MVDLDGATLSARWFRQLLTGGCHDGTGTSAVIDPRGVQLCNGSVEDVLNLENVTFNHPLYLRNVTFTHQPILDGAEIDHLDLAGSRLPGLSASFVTVRRHVRLDDTTVTGTLNIASANIGGQVSAINATFDAAGQPVAIWAGDATIKAGIDLLGATVTGTLNIASANIGGHVSAISATFDAGGQLWAVWAQGATIAQSLYLNSAVVTGTVAITRANIGGQLSASTATFDAARRGHAVVAEGVTISQGMYLNGVTVTGTLAISRANIGGKFLARHATFDGSSHGLAIDARGARISEGMDFDGATVTGTLDLTNANIGGQISAFNATFEAARKAAAIMAWGATIGQIFQRDFLRVTVGGKIDLSGADVGLLVDSPDLWGLRREQWGFKPTVQRDRPSWQLEGLTYRRLDESAWPPTLKTRVKLRIRWLDGNDTASPSIYQELAGEYRRVGHPGAARRVLIAGNDRLNRPEPGDSRLRRLGKSLRRWGFGRTVGYGYQAGRALIGVLLVAAVLAVLVSSHEDVMVATYQNKPITANQTCSQGAPCFEPAVYALDVVLPIVSLGQQKDWKPDPSDGGWGVALKWLVYVATAAGWVFATLVVAAFSGVLKRV
jgi:hypothetical protein